MRPGETARRGDGTAPHVVFLSGTLHAGSKADRIAAWCARRCRGATTTVFTGEDLEFPHYRYGLSGRHPQLTRYLYELANSDGVVLLSPAYHGTISGLLKNALDYANDLAQERRPFLQDRSIGCVALALGDQGAASTLATLRTVAHALRGWPTPLGVTLTAATAALRPDGEPARPETRDRLDLMLGQVMAVARRNAEARRRFRVRAALGPEPVRADTLLAQHAAGRHHHE
ncbi:NADPH-dependent FMN reductase [Actinomadura oligospora]|uniref:NADPH-dependent FMN reductase n=1 Tax=Actinomadura oligospora TaxID=111804 RepID=UPI0007E8E591|nr:NAD(P)H-dependent oxidoreductase [Actinomadura oligospora]